MIKYIRIIDNFRFFSRWKIFSFLVLSLIEQLWHGKHVDDMLNDMLNNMY